MERRIIEEEEITMRILTWLKDNGWHIICYDFPQSGTGYVLKPDGSRSKNKGCINPDIVAVNPTTQICVFFENKNRYYSKDFQKQHSLITNNQYTLAIGKLLSGYRVKNIYYGIGLPTYSFTATVKEKCGLVDFVIGISPAEIPPKIFHCVSQEIFGTI